MTARRYITDYNPYFKITPLLPFYNRRYNELNASLQSTRNGLLRDTMYDWWGDRRRLILTNYLDEKENNFQKCAKNHFKNENASEGEDVDKNAFNHFPLKEGKITFKCIVSVFLLWFHALTLLQN